MLPRLGEKTVRVEIASERSGKPGSRFLVPRAFRILLASGAVAAVFAIRGAAPAQETPKPAAQRDQLPPKPAGKATVIGGRINALDPVQDRFSLGVYGSKPMEVLYDARTELYRDGARAPLSTLKPHERASVETTLDGTSVFALTIHILSQAPAGECEGSLVRLDAAAGFLEVVCGDAAAAVRFHAAPGVPVELAGRQPGTFAGLTPESLVAVEFSPARQGEAEATRIRVLAAPGQVFTFAGAILSLDLSAGRMVLQDPRDGATYSIDFNPQRFPESAALREGMEATVTAGFDGRRYTASVIQPR